MQEPLARPDRLQPDADGDDPPAAEAVGQQAGDGAGAARAARAAGAAVQGSP